MAIDIEHETVEFLPAEQVGQRLACGAARAEAFEAFARGVFERVVVVREQPGALAPEHRAEQELRVEPRDAQTPRPRQRLGDVERLRRHAPLSSAASCWAARAACSAAMTSSRSPSRIACSRYSVRLMRWSVSRPCGKL